MIFVEDWILIGCLVFVVILFYFMLSAIRSLRIELKWLEDKVTAYSERIARLSAIIKKLKNNEEL